MSHPIEMMTEGSDGPEGRSSSVRPVDDEEAYIAVGDLVAGKYRVERVLGRGGMAFVLSAKHVELEESFALKFLNRDLVRQEEVIARFAREAKAACKIRSEHVARVYDVGTHDGVPFIVMEQLEGEDLGTLLARGGPLPIDDAVEYMMQACQALAAAHASGVVHRDIKPENLFLVEHEGLPILKLLDFGISKVALTQNERGPRLTGTLRLGTPQYMSPEQIRSTASADARSDIWSLGVVLYELLTGAAAFRADTITGLCAMVLEGEPRPLRELRPDVPDELVDVVARCLQKDPADRFANVVELAVALLPFAPMRAQGAAERTSSILNTALRADDAPRASRRPPRSGAPSFVELNARDLVPTQSLQPSVRDPGARSSASAPRRPWGVASAAALLLVASLGGAVMYRTQGKSPRTKGDPASAAAPPQPVMPMTPTSPAPAATAAGRAADSASAATRGAVDGTVGVDEVVMRALRPRRGPVPRSAPPAVPHPHPSTPPPPRASATTSQATADTASASSPPSASPAAPAVELGY